MRLICPNCGAQYEVEDAVIPENGRDVQCSNCGHTWFQQPAHGATDHPSEFETGQEGPAHPEPEEPAEPEAVEEAEDVDARGAATDTSDEPAGVRPSQPPTQRERRELDPAIAEMLREEAEREAEARKRGTEGLESQPDLGLDATEGRPRRAPEPDFEPEEDEDEDSFTEIEEPPGPREAGGGSRRDLLPEIDDVSTLPPGEQPMERETFFPAEPAEVAGQRRRGFRGGFLVTLVLLLTAVGVYAFAPRIAEMAPEAEPYLVTYVDLVNAARTRVDGWIDAGAARLSDLIAQVSAGGEDAPPSE